jgi:hypothetical protein
MRLWRTYRRIALSGLVFLAGMTTVSWLLRAPAAGGFLILTYYWIALCLIVGLILLFATALRRSANRFAKPS